MTPETAAPTAAMVAKDYPFYLKVKRTNCALDVQAASFPATESEVPQLGVTGHNFVPL